jgi:hypothetical protein
MGRWKTLEWRARLREKVTAAEILEALRALPPGERRALALALLRSEPGAEASGESPVDTSHAWPVFTAPLAKGAGHEVLDHRFLREAHVDDLVERALGADRL